MAITIDGKQYDETKLDEVAKSAIVQVSQAQNRLRTLSLQSENEKILIKHHSEWLKANLPAAALIETGNGKDKAADKPAEEAKAE